MKYIALLFLGLPPSAYAAKITYHKGQTHFVVEHDSKTLIFSSASLKHVFIIDNCNRRLLDSFWKKTLRNAQSFPHATSVPEGKRGYVQIDKEYRYIMPITKNRLSNLENEILFLQSEEKKLCKR